MDRLSRAFSLELHSEWENTEIQGTAWFVILCILDVSDSVVVNARIRSLSQDLFHFCRWGLIRPPITDPLLSLSLSLSLVLSLQRCCSIESISLNKNIHRRQLLYRSIAQRLLFAQVNPPSTNKYVIIWAILIIFIYMRLLFYIMFVCMWIQLDWTYARTWL